MSLQIDLLDNDKYGYSGVMPSSLYRIIEVSEPVLGGWTLSNPHHRHYTKVSIEFNTEKEAIAHAENKGYKVG